MKNQRSELVHVWLLSPQDHMPATGQGATGTDGGGDEPDVEGELVCLLAAGELLLLPLLLALLLLL